MKYIIFFLLLIFLSCKNETEKEVLNIEGVALKIKDESSFVFSDSSYLGIADRKEVFVCNDSMYFYTLNGMQQKLEVINLTSKKKRLEINFYNNDEFLKEQLNFEDFYIHNLDSIFLFSSNNSKLTLIDKNGFINRIWNISEEISKKQSDAFLQITNTGLSSFYYDKQNELFLFRSYPPYDSDKDPAFYNKPFGINYDLKDSLLKESFGRWPSHFIIEDGFLPNNFILKYIPFFKEQVYYVSYRYDHNIYKYSLINNELLDVYDGKSNYLEEFSEISKAKAENSQNIIDYITENGCYKNFVYQKEKKQFYRVVVHNQQLINEKTNKIYSITFNRSFSIIIFDDKMLKIGEYKFEQPEGFTFFDVIPTPKGLMINYKDSEDENKNHFRFITF